MKREVEVSNGVGGGVGGGQGGEGDGFCDGSTRNETVKRVLVAQTVTSVNIALTQPLDVTALTPIDDRLEPCKK